ncbi:hypothetical protein RB195_003649 [Necator americanus]|uniref:Uncharacterized protein n=1 Tax=Necator americanus TaxID=51031 RepID=A0ABR1DPJ0_NECAM
MEPGIFCNKHSFFTLNRRTVSSELKQTTLSKLLRYFCVPFAALQETCIKDRPVINIGDYTTYCSDADEKNIGGRELTVRNDCKSLVEKFGSTLAQCAAMRLRDRRGRKFRIVSVHSPTERERLEGHLL